MTQGRSTRLRPPAFILIALLAAPVVSRAEPTIHPSLAGRFRLTTFASGLNFPSSMQQLADGSLLVGTSDPASGGSIYNSTGSLLRFTDTNRDGVADGPGQVVATGLTGTVTSVRQAGELLFVTSSRPGQEKITVMRMGSSPGDSLTALGTIDFAFPSNTLHTTYALAVRESSTTPGSFQLFFNVGSRTNADRTTTPVPVSGLIDADLNGDSIYRVTVTDSGSGAPSFSAPEQIATGLRNAAGIAFDPLTGDLFFQDNGIDGLSNSNEPHSADELNRIAVGDIGGAIEDFGFPDDFVPYRTGGQGGSDDSLLVAFQPIPDPSNGLEAEGANEIAFAPDTFRSILGHGVFIGFHGRFNGAPSGVDAENPLVFYDLASDSYIHFIEGNQDGLGHLDGLLATGDRLYLSDLSTIGPVTFGGAGQGAIYVLTAIIPEPSSVALTALGLAGLFGLAARRSRRSRLG
ncbi:PQQ-dependent sugar dehydrogenase [Tautonia plasticadhaerens]|uniref:PEP-CTERM motif protein n=1 Tax=Tautonia plasticadhaerens TaxID=2527974 RepID=A0A518GVW8_9BACT|nr:PEP-CTERM sorting domain-containing protein [Tautonia plasticadhaerens]QDV32709.1 PEP-CTERM motif protein [Tautonia plasticadhaerens]